MGPGVYQSERAGSMNNGAAVNAFTEFPPGSGNRW